MQNTAPDLIDTAFINKGTTTVDSQSSEEWTWALAFVRAAGGSPTPDFLELVEQEKRGEITTADIKEYLDKKYKAEESD